MWSQGEVESLKGINWKVQISCPKDEAAQHMKPVLENPQTRWAIKQMAEMGMKHERVVTRVMPREHQTQVWYLLDDFGQVSSSIQPQQSHHKMGVIFTFPHRPQRLQGN
jgi:hypothetical protein